jgi:hypothetical protein
MALVLALLSIACATRAVDPVLSVTAHADNTNGLNFSVLDAQGRVVIQSQPLALAFFVEERWHQLNNGLVLMSARNVSGKHPILGKFTGHESTWAAGKTKIICAIHAHSRAVTFAQIYPDGATGTNVTTQSCQGGSEGSDGCMSEPFGYFPAINPDAGALPNLTYFGLSGNMNEYHERGVGLVQPYHGLPSTGGYRPDGPTDSGPFVLFEERQEHGGGWVGAAKGLHLLLSPMNNFMVFSQALGDNLHGLNITSSGTTSANTTVTSSGTTSANSTISSPTPSTATPANPVCGVNEQKDSDFGGRDILVNGKLHPIASNSSEDCCSICTNTVGCGGWVWIGPAEPQPQYRNLCYPKTSVGTGAHRIGKSTVLG